MWVCLCLNKNKWVPVTEGKLEVVQSITTCKCWTRLSRWAATPATLIVVMTGNTHFGLFLDIILPWTHLHEPHANKLLNKLFSLMSQIQNPHSGEISLGLLGCCFSTTLNGTLNGTIRPRGCKAKVDSVIRSSGFPGWKRTGKVYGNLFVTQIFREPDQEVSV